MVNFAPFSFRHLGCDLGNGLRGPASCVVGSCGRSAFCASFGCGRTVARCRLWFRSGGKRAGAFAGKQRRRGPEICFHTRSGGQLCRSPRRFGHFACSEGIRKRGAWLGARARAQRTLLFQYVVFSEGVRVSDANAWLLLWLARRYLACEDTRCILQCAANGRAC